MPRLVLCFLLVYVVTDAVRCRTILQELRAPSYEELTFMKKYGYLPSEDQADLDYAYTAHSVSEAVRKMQAFAGLPPTGLIDPPTQKLFKKRRCGVKDIEDNSMREKRFILQQGWNKRSITYRVLNGPTTLPKSRVEELMEACVSLWAPHGGLRFYRKDDGPADIELSFASAEHGDGFPFDGPGHVVAHAFPPPHGAMHFDDDEVWGGDPAADPEGDDPADDVTDFFAVAVHEFGHALGLSHSNVKSSVMYPYYQVPVEKLHIDDIMGMRELYLKSALPEEVTTTAAPSARMPMLPHFTRSDAASSAEDREEEEEPPDVCYSNYDTVQVINGEIYVFEELWLWVFKDRKELKEGYPKQYHEVFRGLPRHVDVVKAVYQREDGTVVIFSGREMYEFSATLELVRRDNMTSRYSLPAHLAELTTAFLSNYNNKTYLIEYERFWRYDEREGRMDAGYPKSMSAWRRLPAPVDAALVWRGDTYFFRGPRYWRFDNKLVQVHRYYPLPTAAIWFPCPLTEDTLQYTSNDLR